MNKKKCMILALAVLPMLNSCSDWLDPKPLSFYSPENTYVDAAGLYAALTACERNMRHEFFGDGAPILTEMYLTDIAEHIEFVKFFKSCVVNSRNMKSPGSRRLLDKKGDEVVARL